MENEKYDCDLLVERAEKDVPKESVSGTWFDKYEGKVRIQRGGSYKVDWSNGTSTSYKSMQHLIKAGVTVNEGMHKKEFDYQKSKLENQSSKKSTALFPPFKHSTKSQFLKEKAAMGIR